MKISQALTPALYEFACHSAACRPPGKNGGTGGSSKGGAAPSGRSMRNPRRTGGPYPSPITKAGTRGVMFAGYRRGRTGTGTGGAGGGRSSMKSSVDMEKSRRIAEARGDAKPGSKPGSQAGSQAGTVVALRRKALNQRVYGAPGATGALQVKAAGAARTGNIVRVKMSADGVPWATPNTKPSRGYGPDNPRPIFQSPASRSLRQTMADHPKYKGTIAPGKHQITPDNPQDSFQPRQKPHQKIKVSGTSKAAKWWRDHQKKKGGAVAYA